jgi:inosine-uridine nucleoside N-ribohydrolase
MKKYLSWICLLMGFSALAQKPIPVIFDTDIGPDYDDVGAMALLHAFADKGEVKILATMSCNAFETTGPTLSVLNTYFHRPGIPIGVTKGATPNKSCKQQWAQAIIRQYPHALKSNEEAMDAVKLYRKILGAAADKSVTIISVGFFTNLANLLSSAPDEYSALQGRDLVERKVNHLVSMAARNDPGDKGGYEFNVAVDAPASKKVFDTWPTPITLSGFEIGEKILTGIRLINNASIMNSPVKDAFRIALASDSNSIGRNSWDETAVLVAVRGQSPYFKSRKLTMEVLADGKNIVVPGTKFTYLLFAQKPEEIATTIETLMMHQPK